MMAASPVAKPAKPSVDTSFTAFEVPISSEKTKKGAAVPSPRLSSAIKRGAAAAEAVSPEEIPEPFVVEKPTSASKSRGKSSAPKAMSAPVPVPVVEVVEKENIATSAPVKNTRSTAASKDIGSKIKAVPVAPLVDLVNVPPVDAAPSTAKTGLAAKRKFGTVLSENVLANAVANNREQTVAVVRDVEAIKTSALPALKKAAKEPSAANLANEKDVSADEAVRVPVLSRKDHAKQQKELAKKQKSGKQQQATVRAAASDPEEEVGDVQASDSMEEQAGGGDWDEPDMPAEESVRETVSVVAAAPVSIPPVPPTAPMAVKSWRDMPSVAIPRGPDGARSSVLASVSDRKEHSKKARDDEAAESEEEPAGRPIKLTAAQTKRQTAVEKAGKADAGSKKASAYPPLQLAAKGSKGGSDGKRRRIESSEDEDAPLLSQPLLSQADSESSFEPIPEAPKKTHGGKKQTAPAVSATGSRRSGSAAGAKKRSRYSSEEEEEEQQEDNEEEDEDIESFTTSSMRGKGMSSKGRRSCGSAQNVASDAESSQEGGDREDRIINM
jgi:hypothetical protein